MLSDVELVPDDTDALCDVEFGVDTLDLLLVLCVLVWLLVGYVLVVVPFSCVLVLLLVPRVFVLVLLPVS